MNAIGAFSNNIKGSSYQDSVAAPLDRVFDDDAVEQDDGDDDEGELDAEEEATFREVLSAVQKVRFLCNSAPLDYKVHSIILIYTLIAA